MSECTVSRQAAGSPLTLPRLLSRYFRIHGNSDGDTIRLPLQIDFLGNSAPRMATVNLQPRALARAAIPTYSIFWSIDDVSAIPPFCGILTISRDRDIHSSILTISGTYNSALGIAGAAIEALSGRSIAREIAGSILDEIAGGLEPKTLAYA